MRIMEAQRERTFKFTDMRFGMVSTNRTRVAAVMVMGAAVFVLNACGSGSARSATDAGREEETAAVLAPEDVALVTRSALSSGIELEGTLRPHEVVQHRAQIPGVVSRILVDRGEAVQKGQLLAVIAAEGIRSMAASARAQVAAAEAALALARRQLESARMLHEAGAVSEMDLRSAESAYEAANGRLAAAEAQAAAAAESAGQTRIRATMNGAVSDRAVNEGEAVVPGQALLTVVNSEVLELAGHIPVDAAAAVHPGQVVAFTMDAYPGRTFRGEVERVEPVADPDTRQVGVYLRLPNPNLELIGGLFAIGSIRTERLEDAVVVPAEAVRQRGGESFVWTIEDGIVRRRLVTTGVSDAARGIVQVLAGLDPGERVLAAPGRVTAGMRVRIGSGKEQVEPAAEIPAESAESVAEESARSVADEPAVTAAEEG